MLSGLEHKSVRGKWISTSMLVTGLAILVGLVVSIVEDVRYTRQITQEQLIVLADMVAVNSASALAFNDSKAATKTLQLLHANKIIASAKIVDQRENIFAKYKNETINKTSWLANYPALTTLVVERPITINHQPLGTLLVSANMTEVWSALIRQWLAKLAILSSIFFSELLCIT